MYMEFEKPVDIDCHYCVIECVDKNTLRFVVFECEEHYKNGWHTTVKDIWELPTSALAMYLVRVWDQYEIDVLKHTKLPNEGALNLGRASTPKGWATKIQEQWRWVGKSPD